MTVQEEIQKDKEFNVARFRKGYEKECEVLSDDQIEMMISMLKALAVTVVDRNTKHIPQD
jgi:D-alanine-D-alanine ligase-like ATP-grasp enzyme